jgi:hypothetical protein
MVLNSNRIFEFLSVDEGASQGNEEPVSLLGENPWKRIISQWPKLGEVPIRPESTGNSGCVLCQCPITGIRLSWLNLGQDCPLPNVGERFQRSDAGRKQWRDGVVDDCVGGRRDGGRGSGRPWRFSSRAAAACSPTARGSRQAHSSFPVSKRPARDHPIDGRKAIVGERARRPSGLRAVRTSGGMRRVERTRARPGPPERTRRHPSRCR